MKSFLSIVLLSCFTIAAQATPLTLPKDVTGLSYLTNGEIINVRDITPHVPAECLRPGGPICVQPPQMKKVTVQFTLPGCLDLLGDVKSELLVNSLPIANERLAISAVAIHRKASETTRCFVANTQTAEITLFGSSRTPLELVPMNLSGGEHVFKDLPRAEKTLTHSDDIEVVKTVVKNSCPPGRMCVMMGALYTEVTLKVHKGSCVNKSMPVASISNYVDHFDGLGSFDLFVDAPVVQSKDALRVFCAPNSMSALHKVAIPGVVMAKDINVIPLN